MYATPDMIIDTVRKFGINHPKPVQTLLDAADALADAEADAPGWDGVLDPAKVGEVVRAHAQHKLTSGKEMREAINQAQLKIAQALSAEVKNNLDSYIPQIEDVFAPAAEAYAEAVKDLPREFTATEVTDWAPAQFDAYTRAKQASQIIEQAKNWMLNLGKVVRAESFPNHLNNELIVLEPDCLERYAAIQKATGNTDPAMRAVNPVRLRAVQDGARLQLQLPSRVREVVAGFERERQVMTPWEDQQLHQRTPSY